MCFVIYSLVFVTVVRNYVVRLLKDWQQLVRNCAEQAIFGGGGAGKGVFKIKPLGGGTKCVSSDIYSMLTIQGLSHWVTILLYLH